MSEDHGDDRTRFSPSQFEVLKEKVERNERILIGEDEESGLRKKVEDFEKKLQFLQGVLWVAGALGTILLFILDKVL